MFDLYEARVISRKTQSDLAKSTGLNPRRIRQIEKGKIQPTPEERERLANALALRVFEIDWEATNASA